MTQLLPAQFFNRDAQVVARDLLGKVLRHKVNGLWLCARIIETEAYYIHDKGSHASLGYTEKRKALFMPAGTIYMYYARGRDSFNTSCRGDGNAVLFKAGFPYCGNMSVKKAKEMQRVMQAMNPVIYYKTGSKRLRPVEKLCSGQTLLCRSLGLKVAQWCARSYDPQRLRLEDVGYCPEAILQTQRLGIPEGRDEHLPYRFIDKEYVKYCTQVPRAIEKIIYSSSKK